MGNLIEEMHNYLKEIYPLWEDKLTSATTTPLQGTEENGGLVEALWKLLARLRNLQKLVVRYWSLIWWSKYLLGSKKLSRWSYSTEESSCSCMPRWFITLQCNSFHRSCQKGKPGSYQHVPSMNTDQVIKQHVNGYSRNLSGKSIFLHVSKWSWKRA